MPTFEFRGSTVAISLVPGRTAIVAIHGELSESERGAIAEAKTAGAAWMDVPQQAVLSEPHVGFVLQVGTRAGDRDFPYLVARIPKLVAALRLAVVDPGSVWIALFADVETLDAAMAVVASLPDDGLTAVQASAAWVGHAATEGISV